MDMENFCLKSCGQIERMLFASRLQVPFAEFRQVICFEEHILCHALSVRCGTLPMFSFGIPSVWLLSERVSMLTKLLRVSLMLGNVLILRMSYRSELVSDGYTSITRGRNRTRNVTRYAKAFKDRGSPAAATGERFGGFGVAGTAHLGGDAGALACRCIGGTQEGRQGLAVDFRTRRERG